MSQKECTGCDKGLVFIAKVVINGTTAEFDKLRLCELCRVALHKTIEETFKAESEA